jgi:antitoxin (DNA-binding transcriptional repressor) of toxin-antitoxin stability system
MGIQNKKPGWVSLTYATQHYMQTILRLERGEELTLTHRGKPVALMIPFKKDGTLQEAPPSAAPAIAPSHPAVVTHTGNEIDTTCSDEAPEYEDQ